jgi:hypothetical protein
METVRTETGSSLSCWRTCPKKYEFQYDKRLQSKGYSSSLGYGSFVHAMRAIYHSRTLGKAALERALEDVILLKGSLMRQHPDFADKIEADHDLAKGVVELWHQYWSDNTDALGERMLGWVDVEKEWSFKVGDKYRMAGKRDGLVLQAEWEKTFLYELKTASNSDKDSYLYRLHLDQQINANLLALTKAGIAWSGVLYDIIWKPALRLKTGRKTMPDETPAELNERILEEMRANPGQYFTRASINRTPESLTEYEQELEAQFKTLDTMDLKYRNATACKTFGSMCQFFDLCMDPSQSETIESFTERARKHAELSTGG